MHHATVFKVVSAGVIWGQAIVGGYLPFVIHDRVSVNVTSVLNMFAGGIFLASSCLHLLPDAQTNKALQQAGCFANGKCFPLAYFFYVTGFLLVLLLEVFAHALERHFGTGKSHEHTPLIVNTANKQQLQELTASFYGSSSAHVNGSSRSHHGNSSHKARVGHSDGVEKEFLQSENSSRSAEDVISPSDNVCIDMEVTHAHIDGIKGTNPMLAFVVFGALSFHSVMEGVGLGSTNTAMWDILIAILAHKALATFALSVELQHHKVPRYRLLTTIVMFSMMTPLGIFLGWLVVDTGGQTAASGICTAMAGGTFLFVAVMETIPQELQNQKYLLVKCCALLGGFAAMGLLSMWT